MPSRAGSPNRNKQFLLNRLKDMYGEDFHPIIQMADNAVLLQERVDKLGNNAQSVDIINALKAWGSVAEYVSPKLKAIELTAEIAVEEDVIERIDKLTAFLTSQGVNVDEL